MKCKKCDGLGTVAAPPNEDGRYVCPACYGSGQKNVGRVPWAVVNRRTKRKIEKSQPVP
jgi:DnaJ-class molecular chaperone